MSSRLERRALWCAPLLLVALAGCGLEPPTQPAPLDCTAYDMAAERFPVSCAPPEEDAGKEEDAGTDEDLGDEDAGDVDAGDEDLGP